VEVSQHLEVDYSERRANLPPKKARGADSIYMLWCQALLWCVSVAHDMSVEIAHENVRFCAAA
jgi:hypothetical protein